MFEYIIDNMPNFMGKPYENQEEISVFSAIFPHFIYSFEYKGFIYPNPAIKTCDNFEETIFCGFEITQDNFIDKLKKETKGKIPFFLSYSNKKLYLSALFRK